MTRAAVLCRGSILHEHYFGNRAQKDSGALRS